MRDELKAFCLSRDGRTLITGGMACRIVIRWVHNLKLANTDERERLACEMDGALQTPKKGFANSFSSPIRSLHLNKDEMHLFVGLDSGEMRILAQDSTYLRLRFRGRLMDLGLL